MNRLFTHIHTQLHIYIYANIYTYTYIHTCIIYFYEFNTGNASGPLKVLFTVKIPGVEGYIVFFSETIYIILISVAIQIYMNNQNKRR